jgi:hypothetical protein
LLLVWSCSPCIRQQSLKKKISISVTISPPNIRTRNPPEKHRALTLHQHAGCYRWVIFITYVYDAYRQENQLTRLVTFSFIYLFVYLFIYLYIYLYRLFSDALRSAAERLLGPSVRIPPGAWMFVSCTVFLLWGRGLCDGPIPRPEGFYRLWCVSECDQVKINTLYTCCE